MFLIITITTCNVYINMYLFKINKLELVRYMLYFTNELTTINDRKQKLLTKENILTRKVPLVRKCSSKQPLQRHWIELKAQFLKDTQLQLWNDEIPLCCQSSKVLDHLVLLVRLDSRPHSLILCRISSLKIHVEQIILFM